MSITYLHKHALWRLCQTSLKASFLAWNLTRMFDICNNCWHCDRILALPTKRAAFLLTSGHMLLKNMTAFITYEFTFSVNSVTYNWKEFRILNHIPYCVISDQPAVYTSRSENQDTADSPLDSDVSGTSRWLCQTSPGAPDFVAPPYKPTRSMHMWPEDHTEFD